MTNTKPSQPWIEWSKTSTHFVAGLRGVSREIIPQIVKRIKSLEWISEVRADGRSIVLYYVNASRGMVESLLRETLAAFGISTLEATPRLSR